MGMAPVAHVVWNKFMTFNPKNPDWVNRDRFVLSYVFSKFNTSKFCWAKAGSWMRNATPATSSMPTQHFSADVKKMTLAFCHAGDGEVNARL